MASNNEQSAEYQLDWRKALHGILAALTRKASEGGMRREDLIEVLRKELRLQEAPVVDALDYLVRDKLIERSEEDGLLGRAIHYTLLPAGVEVIGGGPHKYISFKVSWGSR